MRRFVLFRMEDVSEQTGSGIVAFGCEMWPQGPVALIWTVEPYNQTWLINMDGLKVHKQARTQNGVTIQTTEVYFLDEDEINSKIENLKRISGSGNSFPLSDLHRAFEQITGLCLVRTPPAFAELSVPQHQ